MDLPQFGFVEDLMKGSVCSSPVEGLTTLMSLAPPPTSEAMATTLAPSMLHYAKVEAQLIAVAQGDQRACLHVRLFGQPSIQQHHTAAFDGGALDDG